MAKDRYSYRNVSGGKIESKWNKKTGQWVDTGFVPHKGTRAEMLARRVRNAERWAITGYTAVAGTIGTVAAMAVTALGELIGDVASNPNLVHLAQNVGQIEGAACIVLPIVATVGFTKEGLDHRRSKALANELIGTEPVNKLPALELSRARHSRAGCLITIVNTTLTVAAGGAGAIVGTAVSGVGGPALGAAAATAMFLGLRTLEGWRATVRGRTYFEGRGQMRRQKRYLRRMNAVTR